MAVTRTGTRTGTYARTALIKQNVGEILRQAASADESTIARLSIALDPEKCWVKTFQVLGFDRATGYCRAELRLNIDWEAHRVFLFNGQQDVVIDLDQWANGVSPLIRQAIDIFNDVVEASGLTPEWRVIYSDWVSGNPSLLETVQNTLGTRPVPNEQWQYRPEGLPETALQGLEETSVQLFFESDEESDFDDDEDDNDDDEGNDDDDDNYYYDDDDD
jgi:hypothetical protein